MHRIKAQELMPKGWKRRNSNGLTLSVGPSFLIVRWSLSFPRETFRMTGRVSVPVMIDLVYRRRMRVIAPCFTIFHPHWMRGVDLIRGSFVWDFVWQWLLAAACPLSGSQPVLAPGCMRHPGDWGSSETWAYCSHACDYISASVLELRLELELGLRLG